jgi:hypothetical protein
MPKGLGHRPEDDYEDDLLEIDPVPKRCSVTLSFPDDDFMEVGDVMGKGSVIGDLLRKTLARFRRA